MAEPATAEWTQSVVYRDLVARPELRMLIDAAAARYKPGMSAEAFMKDADKLMSAAGLGAGVSLALVAEIAKPLGEKLGIKTGKTVSQRLELPPGRAIVATLCSLASRGQTLKALRQGADGVVIEAVLPSDMFAVEGTLFVTIRRDGTGTIVEAATKVTGQMFDWGKSSRALRTLLGEIDGLATLQP